MLNKVIKKNITLVIKILIIIFLVIISMPKESLVFISKGLDPSWIIAINYNFAKNLLHWGNYFTYGPLGFVIATENFGYNIIFSIIFWIIIEINFIIGLYYLFKKTSFLRNKILVICSIFLFYISLNPHVINGSRPERFLNFMGLFLLLLSFKAERKIIFLFDYLFIISFFVKFSISLVCLSAYMLLLISLFIYEKKMVKFYLLNLLFSAIVTFVFFIVFIDFSIISFIKYFYGAFQVATGFSVAMSTRNSYYIGFFAIATILYLLSFGFAFYTNKRNFILLLILSGPLFFLYKHGYVRTDHYLLSFSGFMMVSCLFFMFYDTTAEEKMKKYISFFLILIGSLICLSLPNYSAAYNISSTVKRVFSFPKYYNDLKQQNLNDFNILPASFLDEIGNSTVSIYPYEISYVVSNNLNYRQIPTIQIYSAYTPWLDKQNALFFQGENAPKYIILETGTIDNRFPLIEVPQTWRMIKNNYYAIKYENKKLLLKKNEVEHNLDTQFVDETNYNIFTPLAVNSNSSYLKFGIKLTIFGKLTKFLWKIPEVNMTVKYVEGPEVTKRVLLDLFCQGVDLSSICYNCASIVDCLNNDGKMSEIESISFSGSGLKYYKKDIKIKSYSLNNSKSKIYLPFDFYPSVSLPDYKQVSNSFSLAIDKNIKYRNYTYINGWAYYENDDCDVYVGMGGKYYKAEKTKRADVQKAFNLKTADQGFVVNLPEAVTEFDLYLANNTREEIYSSKISSKANIGQDRVYGGESALPKYRMKEEQFRLAIDKLESMASGGSCIVGWAYHDNDDCDVYVGMGGKYYKAEKTKRTDVQKAFNLKTADQGFAVSLPQKLPELIDELAEFDLYLVNNTREEIYSTKINPKADNDPDRVYGRESVLPKYCMKEEKFRLAIDKLESTSSGGVYIKGWAYHDNDDCDVYVGMGGKYYKAEKTKRTDVQKAFNLKTADQGFAVSLPETILEYLKKLPNSAFYLANNSRKEIYAVRISDSHNSKSIAGRGKPFGGEIAFAEYQIAEGGFPYAIDKLEAAASGGSRIVGWAYYDNDDCDVYMCIGDKYYSAEKTERPDVQYTFNLELADQGFTVGLPEGVLGVLKKMQESDLYLINHTLKKIYKIQFYN